MVDVATDMLVRSDVVSHMVVVVAVIAETGVIPAYSDAAGVKKAEMDELKVSPDVMAKYVVVVEDLTLTSVVTFVETSRLIVLTALKLLPN